MGEKKRLKTGWKVLLWIVGVWAVLLAAVQLALSPSVLTRLANRYAAEYVDADVSFGEVRLSVLRSFPYLNIGFSDFTLTYPSDRFEAVEDSSYYMMRQGRGSGADTLASFRRLYASVDASALLSGTVRLPVLTLDKPRIFAKNYADGRTNWNIFRLPAASEKADSSRTEPLKFALGRIILSGRPHIVYSSPADTLFAMADFRRLRFNGRLAAESWTKAVGRMQAVDSGRRIFTDSSVRRTAAERSDSASGLRNAAPPEAAIRNQRNPGLTAAETRPRQTPARTEAEARRLRNASRRDSLRKVRRARRNRIGLRVDSMLVAGRLPSDTLLLRLDRLGAQLHQGHVDLDASATGWLGTRSYGRIAVPVGVRAEVGFHKDSVTTLDILDCRARIAGIPLKVSARVSLGDRMYMRGNAAIERCRVNRVLDYFRDNLLKAAENIDTDAEISLALNFDGCLNPSAGEIPAFDARLTIPRSTLDNKLFDLRHELALNAEVHGSGDGVIDVRLNNFHVMGKALHVDLRASVHDLLGADPLVDADAGVQASLDTLSRYLRRRSGLELSGNLSAEIRGGAALSQLDPYQLAQTDISGKLRGSRLRVVSEKDSISFLADSLDLWLGAVGNTRDSSVAQGERMLALTASVDSIFLSVKDDMRIAGRSISLKAQNSAAVLDKTDSSFFYPFGGRLDIGSLSVVGADTTYAAVSSSSSIFKISPKSGAPEVPVLTLDSSNGGVFLRGPVNRIFARDLDLDATAAMNSIQRRRRSRAFVDSLARMNPDVPRDSLFRHYRRSRGSRPMPDWLSEEDFRARDIRIDLGETLTRYLREWDFEGGISLGRAGLVSPRFPLRSQLRDVRASFNNDEIRFDSFSLRSGRSDLSARGELGGLREAIRNRGMLRLRLDLGSRRLNVNELLAAWQAGSAYEPVASAPSALDISDEQYEDMVAADSLETAVAPEPSLIVIPANIVADLSLKAADVSYATLRIDTMTTDIAIRERCVQLTNTVANSSIGDIEFEGFYSTRTKRDLKTGFDLQLKDITAEKVIEMMPAVDSVMSMLKSFRGRLNCTVSATADMDTSMNILTPSISGIIRISGDDLTLSESTAFTEIARKLRFKDRTSGHIDHMSVEGLIADNMIEVFPFVLKVDRYTLAMSGVQNLDSSFKYHVSVIESPLPFRVGIDLSGNFDDFSFRIGRPKYKSADVPVFSQVIDETRINLRESIRDIFRQGIDRAVRENAQQKLIHDYKRRIDYREVVDERLDSLSAEEKARLEAQEGL